LCVITTKNTTYSHVFFSYVCKKRGYSHLVAVFDINVAKALELKPHCS